MLTLLVKFTGICIFDSDNISCIFDYGDLHSEADSKVWNLAFSCVFCSQDHALNSAVAKASRNEDTVQSRESFFYIKVCQIFWNLIIHMEASGISNGLNGKIVFQIGNLLADSNKFMVIDQRVFQ